MGFYLLQENGSRLLLEHLSGAVLLEEVAPEPHVVFLLGGGDDAPAKRRKKQRELFQEMERTMVEILHPPVPVSAEPVAARPVVQVPPRETLEEQLQALLTLAGESHDLLQRVQRLRSEAQQIAAEQALRDEEDDFILLMS